MSANEMDKTLSNEVESKNVVGYFSSLTPVSDFGPYILNDIASRFNKVTGAKDTSIVLAGQENGEYHYRVRFTLPDAVDAFARLAPYVFAVSIVITETIGAVFEEVGLKNLRIVIEENPSDAEEAEAVIPSGSEYEMALARGDENALKAIDELDYDRIMWGQFP
jgi:hypothetical protein